MSKMVVGAVAPAGSGLPKIDVIIVGGGPAGLMLAIELGCRDIRCVLLEEDPVVPAFPKANATSARTMEHYRRRGFSAAIRELGLPPDHPQDVVYCTRLASHEMARFHIPSRAQARSQSSFGDYGESAWPTPELPHRAQQMYIEPILKQQAERYSSVDVRFGHRVMAVRQTDTGVQVDAATEDGDNSLTLEASYLVGCDGARSMVRKAIGSAYAGESREQRDFFGGQMLSIFFQSSDLYAVIGKEKAWQYWAINPGQRGLIISVDGLDTFIFCVQLKPGQQAADIDAYVAARAVVGADFEFRLLDVSPWTAGYTLVAESFSSGRIFIAGDAAHLFTPTGGLGYNTSIDDAVNLGWKLAGVIRGWAPQTLLETYELERHPIAVRNTVFARNMADSIGKLSISPTLEGLHPDDALARDRLSAALSLHVRNEFNIPGMQLGLRYANSPVVASESGMPPEDEPNVYIPSGFPGARAPHMAVGGDSLFDYFGRDFTLLALAPVDFEPWALAARRMGMPLSALQFESADMRRLYGADLVLIRPDHHIAWRGAVGVSPEGILGFACGHEMNASADEQGSQSERTQEFAHE